MSKRISKQPMFWVATAMLIVNVILGIVFETHPLKVFPICVSCFVMLLQSRVSRYAFLVGGINSLFYTFAYVIMQLYVGAANALFISFPMQIITFINWNKNTQNGETKVKKLKAKEKIILLGLVGVIWSIAFLLFAGLKSPYIFFDNTSVVLSFVAMFLCMFRYSEFALLNVMSSLIGFVLYIIVTCDDVSNIVWVIYMAYVLVCQTMTFVKINRQIRRAQT